MQNPRRPQRRENGKDRLYNALRELYLDGVRVCTGRYGHRTAKPAAPAPREKVVKKTRHLCLLDDVNSGSSDPYNSSRR